MILVLSAGAGEAQERVVLDELRRSGMRGVLLHATERPVVHVVSGPTRLARRLLRLESVEAIVPTSGPRIRREGRRFVPYHAVDWLALALVILGLLVALTGFFPPALGPDPDPLGVGPDAPPAGAPLPWFLAAPARVVRLLPAGLGWLVLLLLVALLFAVPALDRGRGRPAPARRVLVLAVVVAAWLALTLLGGGA